ncbi:MAG: glutaredoxin family protein [Solirubrobacteraceae bacterium]|nr:glutaredoxin family protein [Solirubrobacteraceae bacterium]
MNATRVITLYGRPGCHLCDDALAELAPIAADTGATVEQVNIEEDDALLLAHLERIPVVLVDGVEVCTFFVDNTAVRAALS